MKTEEDGRLLAEKMVAIGKTCGRQVAALLTNMDIPLGNCIGNALEVREAAEVLRGKPGDLREICVALSAELLSLCHGWSHGEAVRRVEDALDSGLAYETMQKWVKAQGGDPDFSHLPQAKLVRPVPAPCSGWLTHMNAQQVGEASSLLGAGRMTKDDTIDYAAGIVLEKKTGDYVQAGETLAFLHTDDEGLLPAAEARFLGALQWGESAPAQQPLLYDVIR